eukprot:36957-Rhodomonas_salina.1
MVCAVLSSRMLLRTHYAVCAYDPTQRAVLSSRMLLHRHLRRACARTAWVRECEALRRQQEEREREERKRAREEREQQEEREREERERVSAEREEKERAVRERESVEEREREGGRERERERDYLSTAIHAPRYLLANIYFAASLKPTSSSLRAPYAISGTNLGYDATSTSEPAQAITHASVPG